MRHRHRAVQQGYGQSGRLPALQKAGVQVMEVQIPGSSPAAGKKLWETPLPKESIVGCVLRGDVTLIPRGDTRILAGDTLVVLAGSGQELNTVHALTGG